MTDSVRVVDYFYVEAKNKPGTGAAALAALEDAGVDLVAFSGFPSGKKRAQLDFVPADPRKLVQAAKKLRWKLVGPKRAFVVEGDDRIGAGRELLAKLAAEKIDVTAIDAVAAGAGRYGAILWVRPRDVKRAAKALGVSKSPRAAAKTASRTE